MSNIPPIRAHFLTWPEAHFIIENNPDWTAALRGDLQTHTDWSDGTGTIEEMAEAALDQAYSWIAITDHSKVLKIAHGIDEAALFRQSLEIKRVNAELSSGGHQLRVLRSIELNLNPRGEGDMSSESLSTLDLVLGCFHSALRRSEDQTARYVAALRNPHIQILGHPRGRIYNYRLGLCADWPRVFDLTAQLDKAVEIDGYPDRQDLSLDLLRLAKQSGCRISLSTDAHGPSQLRFMEVSLAAAILAGIPRERILNFMPADELLRWAAPVRASGA